MHLVLTLCLSLLAALHWFSFAAIASESESPEDVLRMLVQANANRDLAGMAALIAHGSDTIGYSIGGRKYVGWSEFARDMQHEFDSVSRLDITVRDLKLWKNGETAWFVMEMDYTRYPRGAQSRMMLPLRETGVLERRNGKWVLVSWHESLRGPDSILVAGADPPGPQPAASSAVAEVPNLSGEWEIQEDDKSYRASLDRNGNGTYSWQGGRITTTSIADRRWQGTWHQPGNDREGGFELLLSEDGTQAKGVWWYTRVGDRGNIPPRQHGGNYFWKRLTPPPTVSRDSRQSP